MSAAPQSSTGSRSRPQARKKPNDDATYFGPPLGGNGASGTKRQAAEKAEGEPRVKRKRVDISAAANSNRRDAESEPKASLVEFVKMPTPVLYRYLTQFDIIPRIYPSPLSPDDPPAPAALENPHLQMAPHAPSPPLSTPANRPRREAKEQNSRRRSSRLLEEETRCRTPVLADVDKVHVTLAGIVDQHFREFSAVKEIEILSSFMVALERTRGTTK